MPAGNAIPWTWVIILAVAVAVALIVVWRTRLRLPGQGKPLGGIPQGLQFYPNPTAHEPPGTVFRIDPNRTRYLAMSLKVPVHSAPEASGRWRESVTASTGVLAQLLGLAPASLKVGSERTEEITFEVAGLTREVTYDDDLDAIVEQFRKEHKFRADNQYFVIRESWAATSIDYSFSSQYIQDIGGEAQVKTLAAKGTLFTRTQNGDYVLKKKFKTPMRVLFLPEAIRPVSAALGREIPHFDRVQVTRPLVWEAERS
jgi:hypothetical protein